VTFEHAGLAITGRIVALHADGTVTVETGAAGSDRWRLPLDRVDPGRIRRRRLWL
jgi:hypothetical protein